MEEKKEENEKSVMKINKENLRKQLMEEKWEAINLGGEEEKKRGLEDREEEGGGSCGFLCCPR